VLPTLRYSCVTNEFSIFVYTLNFSSVINSQVLAMAKFTCDGCGKSYAAFGSLYKHAVLHHNSKCLRSGKLTPIPAEELVQCKERVRHWGENSRQRRARLCNSASPVRAPTPLLSASFDGSSQRRSTSSSFDVAAPQGDASASMMVNLGASALHASEPSALCKDASAPMMRIWVRRHLIVQLCSSLSRCLKVNGTTAKSCRQRLMWSWRRLSVKPRPTLGG
jgi:hypothetical protein